MSEIIAYYYIVKNGYPELEGVMVKIGVLEYYQSVDGIVLQNVIPEGIWKMFHHKLDLWYLWKTNRSLGIGIVSPDIITFLTQRPISNAEIQFVGAIANCKIITEAMTFTFVPDNLKREAYCYSIKTERVMQHGRQLRLTIEQEPLKGELIRIDKERYFKIANTNIVTDAIPRWVQKIKLGERRAVHYDVIENVESQTQHFVGESLYSSATEISDDELGLLQMHSVSWNEEKDEYDF